MQTVRQDDEVLIDVPFQQISLPKSAGSRRRVCAPVIPAASDTFRRQDRNCTSRKDRGFSSLSSRTQGKTFTHCFARLVWATESVLRLMILSDEANLAARAGRRAIHRAARCSARAFNIVSWPNQALISSLDSCLGFLQTR